MAVRFARTCNAGRGSRMPFLALGATSQRLLSCRVLISILRSAGLLARSEASPIAWIFERLLSPGWLRYKLGAYSNGLEGEYA